MPTRRTAFFILAGLFVGACITAVFLLIRDEVAPPGRPSSTDRESVTDSSPSGDAVTPSDQEGGGELPPEYRGDGVLEGMVVAAGTGPIADAVVGVWLDNAPWAPAREPVVTRTDSQGRFRIEGVRSDAAATLFAFKPGFAVASVEQVESRVETELSLEKGAVVNLVAQNPNGVPLQGVTVQIASAALWPPRQGSTDRDGALRIEGLVPGEYEVFAREGDLNVSRVQQVTLDPQETPTVELLLSPTAHTAFRVVDGAEGTPLSAATVVVTPTGAPLLKQVIRTGDDGRALFPLPLGERYQVLVSAPGFIPGSVAQVASGDSLSVTLERGAIVSGVIQDLSGRPIQGANVQVDPILGDARVEGQDTGGVLFNRTMTAAAAEGWPRLMTVGGGHVIPGPLQVPLFSPISRGEDEAVAGGQAWKASDTEGRFLLNGLSPGRVTLSAEHDDYVMAQIPPEMVIAPGAPITNVVIRMDEGTRVSARVVDRDNFPLGDAEVFVFDGQGRLLGDAISAADGYALFSGLPATFRIEASLDGYVPTFVRHEGKLGESADIRIRLADADKVLQGRVRDARGNSLGDVNVMARAKNRGQIQVLSGVTRPDGRFEIPGAGTGYYNVAANAGTHGVAVATSVTYDDNIQLVVRNDKVFSSNAGVSIPPALDSVSAGEGDGLGVDNLGTTTGFGRASPAISPGDRVILPSAIPSSPPDLAVSDAPDNLGVASGNQETMSVPGTADETVSTPFGEAGELPVTETVPRSGKGGLPISLGGGAGKVLVTRVRPGSRVDVAGLTQGSQILSVDGKQVKSPADARRAIQGTVGTVVMLEVSDKGEVFTLVVQRE